MKKVKATITLLTTFVVSIVLGYSLISTLGSFDEKVVETDYGDTFLLSFDSYRVTTLVQDSQSDFYLVFDKKIGEDDVVGIENSPSLRVYRIDDTVFYSDGNGFRQFDGDFSKYGTLTDSVD